MISEESFDRYAMDPGAFQAEMLMQSPACGKKPFGEIMAEFQRTRFANLNPAMLDVAYGKKPAIRHFWWEATKGCSKDTDLALCVLWLLIFTGRPLTCQVVAADADQAAELRKAAESWLYANPWLAEMIEIDKWELKCEETKCSCSIVATDVAGSHGARPDVLIVNELSHIAKEDAARNHLDNSTKVPNGLVLVATNAGHTGTWQYQLREIARQNPDFWQFEQWAAPSPWLDKHEVEMKRQSSPPSRFNRLFYGIWNSGQR